MPTVTTLETLYVHFQGHDSLRVRFPGPGRPPKIRQGGLFPMITGVSSGPFNPSDFERKSLSRPSSTSSPSFGGNYSESKERDKNLLSNVERNSHITIIPLGPITDESSKRISHKDLAKTSSHTASSTKDPVRRFVHPAAAAMKIHEDLADEDKVSQTFRPKREVVEPSRQSDSAYLPVAEVTLSAYTEEEEEEDGDLVHHEH